MKIGLSSRLDLEEALDLVDEILNHLSDEDVLLPPDLAKKTGSSGVPVENMDVDSLITIGGDGTVLRNLQKTPNTPILGINMGGRGFLADVNPNDAIEAIDKLREGKLELIKRERLAVEISEEKIADALNEGVVRSKEPSGILSFKILVGEEEVEKNDGDGVIVSTPTGSTAYAMTAGGPVIDPEVKAFVAVPLSTHRPKALPLVFPMDASFKVELLEPDKKAYVTVDGQVTKEAGRGDVINFKRSEYSAKFYRWKGTFYEKMREKL